MNTTQAAKRGPEREDAQESEIQDAQAIKQAAADRRGRRRFLRQAIGGACVLALSASGAVALRRVDAKDDDDNSGPGGGGDDNSGRNSGDGDDDSHGDDHDDNSGRGGGDDDDDDHRRHGDDDDVRIAGTPAAGVTEVRITDDDADAFEPQTITVDLGAEVTIFNDDDDDHTATSASFDTGAIAPGESATLTLDEPGSHFYACAFHPEMTGTTVTWENTDTAPHTATAEDGSFDTGRIAQNASGSATFAQAGTFAYRCEFYPEMQGTITVEYRGTRLTPCGGNANALRGVRRTAAGGWWLVASG